MMICYICEHKISLEHKHGNDSEFDTDEIKCEDLKCLCTCHVKSTIVFN
ncbi:hypothetical protein DYY66_1901 [Candidatus Nitrosotalea sp. FS]|nr:hypothetical protein [Candidatus Nitrosotalea sp. FS]